MRRKVGCRWAGPQQHDDGAAGQRGLSRHGHGAQVALLGGLRCPRLKAEFDITIHLTPGSIFPGGGRRLSASREWTDGAVGARIRQPVGGNLTLVGYAGVGGGGGGSDLTYQFMTRIDRAFARDYTARFGYRHLYWNPEKDDAVRDMAARGFSSAWASVSSSAWRTSQMSCGERPY
jgi:hypothetical protein